MDDKRRRIALWTCTFSILACAVWLAAYKLGFPRGGIDDADIFLVYGRSLSNGDGFVFNTGGERVEGFTSFLWVVICSAAMRLSGSPESLLLALNVVLVAATLASCLLSSLVGDEGAHPSLTWAAAVVILVALDFRYLAWSTLTLMETALWGCVLTATGVLLIEDRGERRSARLLAVLSALTVAIRPEAFLWAPAFAGLFFLNRAVRDGIASAARASTPALLAFAITAAGLTTFRLLYFGMPLPNTYYAKISPSVPFRIVEGLKYVSGYLASGPVQMAIGPATALTFVHLLRVRLRDQRSLVLAVLTTIGLIVPVATGGDHFDGFRFYQSVYPIFVLMLVNCVRFIVPGYFARVSRTSLKPRVTLASVSAAFAVLLSVQLTDWLQYDPGPLVNEFATASIGRQRGREVSALFEELQPRPAIATIAVGGFQYGYGGPVVDLMGLNNTAMARNGGQRIGFRSHAAFEKDTLYALKPPIVAPLVRYSTGLAAAGARRTFVDAALKGVIEDARFQQVYCLAEVRRTTRDGDVALAAWYDRRFLTELRASTPAAVISGCTS